MEIALKEIQNKFNEGGCCKFYKIIMINLDILEDSEQ